jgi:hypothetical protein
MIDPTAVTPSPTSEDLLVLYLSTPVDESVIVRLERPALARITQGAYWDRWGVTVEDPTDIDWCCPAASGPTLGSQLLASA